VITLHEQQRLGPSRSSLKSIVHRGCRSDTVTLKSSTAVQPVQSVVIKPKPKPKQYIPAAI